MKLSGLEIPGNGKRVYKDDWDKHFGSLENEITNRNTDLFGHGITSGGSITILGGGVIRLSETVAYNKDGQRVHTPETELTPPEGQSKLLLRHTFVTEFSEPDFSQSSREYRNNSYSIVFTSEVLGEYDVPLFSLQRVGNTVTVLEDLRQWQTIQNKNLGDGIKIGDLANLRNRILSAIPQEALDLITAVNKIDEWLQTHTDNVSNPHNVGMSQLTNYNANNNKVTNLTAGTVSTDALNKGQLDSAVSTINTALSGKSNVGHGHTIADVSNLQSVLDSKSPTSHNHNGVYQPVGDYLTAASVEGKLNNGTGTAGLVLRSVGFENTSEVSFGLPNFVAFAGVRITQNGGVIVIQNNLIRFTNHAATPLNSNGTLYYWSTP
jgi:hypothetical protein